MRWIVLRTPAFGVRKDHEMGTPRCQVKNERGKEEKHSYLESRETNSTDVELKTNERDVLSLPPKYAVYSAINLTDCEAQSKLPDPLSEEIEIKMQGLKQELKEIKVAMQPKVKKASNMSTEQERGSTMSYTDRIRKMESMVFQMDKYGRSLSIAQRVNRCTSLYDVLEGSQSPPPPTIGTSVSTKLLAEIERVNIKDLGDEFIIGSTEVKALYLSLDIDFTNQMVCEVFDTSDVDRIGIDYEELGLYIRLNRI
eukprot:gene6372-7104_t